MKNLPFLIEPIHTSLPPIPTSFAKINSLSNDPQIPESRPIVSQRNEHQNQNINEKDLRKKIMFMLAKDRDKYFRICEKYINGLAVEEDCDTIKNLMAFIENQERKNFILSVEFSQSNRKQMEQEDILEDSSLKGFLSFPTQKSRLASLNTSISQNRLSLLSSNTGFLSQYFSRDKMERLLQLNSIHKNVLNFLQYLKISLQSFAFNEERSWILMKDEIERHLIKSQKNIDKLLDLRDQTQCDNEVRFERKMCKSGGKSKHRQKEDMMELVNVYEGINGEKTNINENTCCDVIKKSQLSNHNNNNKPNKSRGSKGQKHSDYPSQGTFRLYKMQLKRTKQKILMLQVQSSTTLRSSLLSWYQKFLQLILQLKQNLSAVCEWIRKAEKFEENRTQKRNIIQFLLINRAKGVEGLVFLQQIFKGVIINLETKRRQFCNEVEQNMMKKLNSLDSNLVHNTALERDILDQVNTIFFTVQDQLNIASPVSLSTSIEMNKVSDNQSNESSSMSLVEQSCIQKLANNRQTKPSFAQFKQEKQKSQLQNNATPNRKPKRAQIQPINLDKECLKEKKSEKPEKEGKNSIEDLNAKKSKNIVIRTTIPLIKSFTIGPLHQQNPHEQLSSSLEYLQQQKSDSSKPILKTPQKKKKRQTQPQIKPYAKPQYERHPLDELDDLLVIPYGYFLQQHLDDQKIQMKEILSGKKQRKNSDQNKICF